MVSEAAGNVRPCVVLVSSPTPAEITYGPLLATLGDDVRAVPKNLEVCAGDDTPPGYEFGMEVEGIKRIADEAGEEKIHLVGFSAGASACLAFAAKHPGRTMSLALVEPPFIGREGRTPEEIEFFARSESALSLPPAERMGAFMAMVLGPGAKPPEPPPGPPPPWMMRMPIALAAMDESFETYDLDTESLRGFHKPVYFTRGGMSNPVWERIAERLGGILPNLEVEVYEERHHLDAPHTAEPERFARTLCELWARAAVSAGDASAAS
jgi:pimeloyl-ACP methyl ester carboxylesterase